MGKGIVDNLAGDLRKEFPGANGFSAANLWRMKNFYEAYGGDEKLAQLVREIGWSHNISILEKCKSEQEREFSGQVETAYRRLVQDWQPTINKGAGAAPGRASCEPSSGQAARQETAPAPAL